MMSEIERQQGEIETSHHSSKESNNQKVTIKGQAFSGPIPPAAEFASYEDTLEGSADRILSLAERDQQHSHTIQRREQIFYYASKFLAQIIVLLVALGALGLGSYLITEGNSATGISMIVGSLATFAGVVIWGKQKYRSEE